MSIGQVLTDSLPIWPANRTATRDLDEDFSRTVLEIRNLAKGGGLNVDCLIVSALTLVSREAFNWEAAERRANWEERQDHFVEFGGVEGLLSDLHS